MKVVVGSQNPVKIDVVRSGFNAVWPDIEWQVEGLDVDSGVSDQPMSDEESIRGARTRAQTVMESVECDYTVGIEGGLRQVEGRWFDCGWIVARDQEGKEGVASTLNVELPPAMIDMIEQGYELGDVSDHFFSEENSKQNMGFFGLISQGLITRTGGYEPAMVMALSRFVNTDIYNN